jgi:hypothetical protein
LHEISLLNFEDKIFTPLKNIQESQEKLDFMPQLAPLFQRLEERLSQFNFTPTPSWENGFAMARWCLQFKLHPQLYTILQETCVSATLALISKHICTKTELQQAGLSTELPAKLQEIRDYISSLLGINLEVQEIETLRYPLIPEQQEYEDEHEYAQAKQCRLALNTKIANDSNIQAIQSLYQKITTFRNAINHGFMASAADRKIPSRSKNKNMIDDIENAFKDAMCL